MLVIKKGYKRQYNYGGSGLFNTMGQFLSKLFNSQLGTTAKQIAKQSIVDLGKNVVTSGRKTAIHIGKTAIDKGLDKGLGKIHSKLTPKMKSAINTYTGIREEQLSPASVKAGIKSYTNKQLNKGFNALTLENKALLNKIIKPERNINNLIDGSGHHRKKITIQDMVKQMNGGGLKSIK